MKNPHFTVTAARSCDDEQKYDALPLIEEAELLDSHKSGRIREQDLAGYHPHSPNPLRRGPTWRLYIWIMGTLLFLYWTLSQVLLILPPAISPEPLNSTKHNRLKTPSYRSVPSITDHSDTLSCDTWQEGFICEPEISQLWGPYSPYFKIPSEISLDVPDQCKITFAQALSRHGARDPTSTKDKLYRSTVQKIHTRAISYSEDYAFIKDFEYTLGSDQLTAFGEAEMVNSGIQFYHRYRDLARETTPFIRTGDKDRVLQSAQLWAEGFHNALLADVPTADDDYPYRIVEISEKPGKNNTLHHGLCTAFEDEDLSEGPQLQWMDIFTPSIAARLNENIPGVNFTGLDTIFVMDLCPFLTVASPKGELSLFCALFTEQEWSSYSYYQSLGKYYAYGGGNPLGPTQGVGFTNELIARMTGTPVNDHTSTNRTLNDSNDTFPIGGNTVLYADFSHDNDLTSIFAAMGLYNETTPLSDTTLEDINETKGYSASWTVPFASRAYFEKMSCAGQGEEYVRIVVNDRVIPMPTCGGDELGRCTISAFVDSLSFARGGGKWDQCFV